MKEPYIGGVVRDVLKETASLIVDKHGISFQDQQEYVNTIISRISNPYLEDSVERVGRAPMRKLSRKERFVGPAAQLAERGMKYEALLDCIKMALRFQNVQGDNESADLARILQENLPTDATAQLTGLERTHPLFLAVVKVVDQVQSEA
jgi:mannitol-1-phosphate 5-dehydrogenase